ncbi:HMA2 domain-containing protein [Treponema pedis]|uniref:Heavy metal translocating P-type ATPase n=1 Tax=Treponema pedis TaxID=409322 RepID=A0A7S6WPX5_9SPIR|nr:hypothetical protein [Treponema pedis]QOW61150.1 hypothetical protein IFE08_01685 [Treponema pedis]
MITSFFPGRIRLRAAVFKDEEITAAAVSILKKFPALKNIEHNPLTGSILLEYNHSKVDINQLKPLLPILEKLKDEANIYSEDKKVKILSILKDLDKILPIETI